MLDIVIVDDEMLARERLKRLSSELDCDVIAEAENAQEALALIQQHDPSVVLLDIEMPGETGLQVAEKIADMEYPPAVIFTTAYDQYALDAFNTFAAGYLLKPINKEKLKQALDNARSLNKLQLAAVNKQQDIDPAEQDNASPKFITASSHRGVDLIPVDSVRCFLADSKYITVIGTDSETLIDGTLKQFESEYAERFVRIHRNALVSVEHIQGLERAAAGHYMVRLEGVEVQPVVSRRYTSKVKALLHSL